MTDHAWTQERIAAAVAGGLSAEEVERLETHARDCAECAAVLAEARRFEASVAGLFAGVRPGPGLEDRAVRALRTVEVRRWWLTGRRGKAAAALAASVGLGIVGGGTSLFAGEDGTLSVNNLVPKEVKYVFGASPPSDRELTVASEEGRNSRNGLLAMLESHPFETLSRTDLQGLRSGDRTLTRGVKPTLSDSVNANGYIDLTNPDLGLDSELPAAIENNNVLELNVETPVVQDQPPGVNEPKPTGRGFGLNPPVKGTRAGVEEATATAKVDFIPPPDSITKSGAGALTLNYFSPSSGRPVTFDGPSPSSTAPALPPIITNGTGVVPVAPDITLPKELNKVALPDPPPSPPPVENAPARRVVLRSGEVEFEVNAFDPAVAVVTKLVTAIPGAFISTVNSDKLPNGKVKGSVAVRVPPDKLDGLVLDLRRDLGLMGEMKGQRIGSQDVTKQYTDLESHLRAARTMETRLLQIIKEGKGEIKQLLEAEKELGNWRTKIEQYEGELRYYSNLASLSTLSVTLAEKDIAVAATVMENERVQAGIEVEDVEAAFQQAQAAVADAKGRITRSELKQLPAGQLNATLHFEVEPDAAGPVRDRLRQLGRVARLEIDRVQQAEGGTLPKGSKAKRGDTLFLVQLYNLANVAPRETHVLRTAVTDVPKAYQALRDAADRAKGRVLTAQLNEQDRRNVSAQIDVEVRRSEEAGLLTALAAAGEVISRQVVRAADADAVTDSKVLYRTTLVGATGLRPREVSTLAVEVRDVDGSAATLAAQVAEANGRVLGSQVDHEPSGKATAHAIYEVPLSAAAGLADRIKAGGTVRVQQSVRDPQAPDGRFATARLDVTLTNAEPIVAKDDGLWQPVKKGLSFSATVLFTSVTWVVIGLCVVLPWAVIGYGGYRIVRRFTRPAPRIDSPPT